MAAEYRRFRSFQDPLYIAAACLFLLSAVALVLMVQRTLKSPEKSYGSVDARGEGTFPGQKEEPRQQEETKLEDVSSLDLVPKRTVPASYGEPPEEPVQPQDWSKIVKEAASPKEEAPAQPPPRTRQPVVKPKLKLLQRDAGSGQGKSAATSSAFLAAPAPQKPAAAEKAPEKSPEPSPAPAQPQKRRVWRDMDGNFEQR
jgi:hypothetical protein